MLKEEAIELFTPEDFDKKFELIDAVEVSGDLFLIFSLKEKPIGVSEDSDAISIFKAVQDEEGKIKELITVDDEDEYDYIMECLSQQPDH